jgi:hypothetical protein
MALGEHVIRRQVRRRLAQVVEAEPGGAGTTERDRWSIDASFGA